MMYILIDLTRYTAQVPQAGTQTKTIILIIVASPMGNVPRNSDCAGWRIITTHISGYIAYRRIEMRRKEQKRKTFKANTTTEIQYSQMPLYGRLCRRTDTIPVPIMTENHLFTLVRILSKRRIQEVSMQCRMVPVRKLHTME